MDEFDGWDCGVGVFCHFLLELFDVGDCGDVDVELEGLLLRGGFEYESYHLKKISNHFAINTKECSRIYWSQGHKMCWCKLGVGGAAHRARSGPSYIGTITLVYSKNIAIYYESIIHLRIFRNGG